MAEVLSQDEIDALLKNVSSGKLKQEESDTDKETMYLYDFIPTGFRRISSGIFERFMRVFPGRWLRI